MILITFVLLFSSISIYSLLKKINDYKTVKIKSDDGVR